jgi:type III secretion protein T
MAFADLIPYVLAMGFGLARILAVFTMLPLFAPSVLPGSIRTGVAVSMSFAVFPMLRAAPAGMDTLLILALVVKEVVIGLFIGFGAAAVFWAVEAAGFFIDNQRGSTMASSIDPLTGSQTSPIGIFLTQVVTTYFMVGGGFLLLLTAIYRSYELFPVYTFFPTLNLASASVFLKITDDIMAMAILMAAPALIAMFLSEFGLGLVSRFAPQLNVFFMAMPVKSAVGILMLILYIGLLTEVWDDQFARIVTHLGVLRGLME